MIKIDKGNRVVFIRGLVRMSVVKAVIARAERGRKPADWLVIALPDEETTNITCGMAFSPPDTRLEVHGFRKPKDVQEPQ